METRLDFKIDLPEDVIKINKVFKTFGFDLFLVGGSVRDAYLGLKPKDWDLATNAIPDKIIEILKGQPFVTNILETGKAFGVINVITGNDEYEIATFREDGDYTDSRRPDEVIFSTIEKDVLRRDLTINALFYDIEKSQIVDLVDGIYDLRFSEIRTVGEPIDRFNEDKLRKLRAIRFSARFGFNMNSKTAGAITKDNNLIGVSPERIRDEFIKGVKTAKSVRQFLNSLFVYDMFKLIFPGLNIRHFNLIEVKSPIVLMAIIFEGNSPALVKKVLAELKYTSDEIGKIYFLMSFLYFEPNLVYNAKKSQILSKISNDEVIRFAELNNMDIELIDKFLDFKFTVTGEDIEKLGIKPGPEMGKKIHELELENFNKMLNE
jgi:tRNA nucleotidyltransferase/poly(A) polymerase